MKPLFKVIQATLFLLITNFIEAQPYSISPGIGTWFGNNSDMLCNKGNEIEARVLSAISSSIGENKVFVTFEIRKRNKSKFSKSGRASIDPTAWNRCPGSANLAIVTEVGAVDYNANVTTITCSANISVPNCKILKYYIYINSQEFNGFCYAGTFNFKNSSLLTVSPLISAPVPALFLGGLEFNIGACQTWTVSDNASWAYLSPGSANSGNLTGLVRVSLFPNTTMSPRMVSLKFTSGSTSKKINITQNAGPVIDCENATVLTMNTVSSSSTSNGSLAVFEYVVNTVKQTGLSGREKIFRYHHSGGTLSISLQSFERSLRVFVLSACDTNKGVLMGLPDVVASKPLPIGTYIVIVDGLGTAEGQFSLFASSSNQF